MAAYCGKAACPPARDFFHHWSRRAKRWPCGVARHCARVASCLRFLRFLGLHLLDPRQHPREAQPPPAWRPLPAANITHRCRRHRRLSRRRDGRRAALEARAAQVLHRQQPRSAQTRRVHHPVCTAAAAQAELSASEPGDRRGWLELRRGRCNALSLQGPFTGGGSAHLIISYSIPLKLLILYVNWW
jgi:hypothetical protein